MKPAGERNFHDHILAKPVSAIFLLQLLTAVDCGAYQWGPGEDHGFWRDLVSLAFNRYGSQKGTEGWHTAYIYGLASTGAFNDVIDIILKIEFSIEQERCGHRPNRCVNSEVAKQGSTVPRKGG